MNKPVKVLFYTERWTSGGIEAFIMNILRNLDPQKVKADILTSQNETDIYDKEMAQLKAEKITTLEQKYTSPIKRTLKNFMKFRKIIQQNEYDIIHLHICHGVAMIYGYMAKKAGIKHIIFHSHNTNIGNENKRIKTIAHKVCKRLFEKYGTDYYACSDLAAKWLYTKKTLKQGKVKIINNAIEAEKFSFNQKGREELRKELHIDDKFVVGHIGRFNEQKNHGYVIDIFNEIVKKEKNAVLLLIGEGELKEQIIHKIEQLGLKENVILYGLTREIPKTLWAMDVFILPSLFEGKPIVGIETQAAGLKAYVSDTITKTVKISEYIEYLSIKEEPEVWAEKILEKAKNDKRENTYDIICKNGYDIKKVAKEMEENYCTKVGG